MCYFYDSIVIYLLNLSSHTWLRNDIFGKLTVEYSSFWSSYKPYTDIGEKEKKIF